MWFGLIPGPYRVARAFIPRGRTYRRSCNRRPTDQQAPVTTEREQYWWATATAAFVGLCLVLGNNPTQLPNIPKGVPAPDGWWLDVPTGTITPVGPPVPLGTTVRFIPVNTIQTTWTWFIIGAVLLAGAIVTGIVLHRTARWPARYNSPPSGPPRPYLPQPAPLPRPDQPLARSGHKPLNRERPMDRPHPWRTWEG